MFLAFRDTQREEVRRKVDGYSCCWMRGWKDDRNRKQHFDDLRPKSSPRTSISFSKAWCGHYLSDDASFFNNLGQETQLFLR